MTNLYRITAPVAEYGDITGGCQFAKGVYEGPVEPGPLAYMRGAGYTVEPVDAEPDPPHDPSAETSGERPSLPARSAAKPDWVAAAVVRALAEDPTVDEAEIRAAAEANTKEQLIELLTATTEEQTA